MALRGSLVVLAAVCGCSMAAETSNGMTFKANPIRRVVTMLQKMSNKITAEGKVDEATFDKFMCYCQTGAADLAKTISAAEDKIPQLEASIEEAESLKSQLVADLAQHKKDRAEAKEAIASAKSLRAKEADAFAKESSEGKTNIAALAKAIAALEKGMGGFLQTSAAVVLRRLTVEMDLSNTDRDMLGTFLSQGHREGYAPQSGEIVGILKQMKETMEKGLAEATAAEKDAIANFEGLVGAKEKEIASNTKAIEAKLERDSETAVKIVSLKEDLDDTSKSLAADKKFLANLDSNCEKKKAEYEVVKKTRAEELLAIAETIKILNDDDALDLFKKTLPSPSFIQVKVTEKQMRYQALQLLQVARGKHGIKNARLDFLVLALRGQQTSFDKVTTMIDDMAALLVKEQKDDDEKKAYCNSELDKTEDEGKVLAASISDLEKMLEDAASSIENLADEITALEAGIEELDSQVVKATALRKTEHEHFVATLAADKASKELLGFAKNRLNKFYNPKLYKEAPKRALSEEERVVVGMGGTLAPTAPPGGVAGTGIAVFAQVSAHTELLVAPPPPPEAVDAYAKKSEESTGVITMIDMLIADLDKEVQEMEVEEKDSQAEYEQFVADSAAQRSASLKSIAEKEDAKADLGAKVQKAKEEKTAKLTEAMANTEYLKNLHVECDWLLANYVVRKEARAGEVDALKKAKAVLSGADYSLVQMAHAHQELASH